MPLRHHTFPPHDEQAHNAPGSGVAQTSGDIQSLLRAAFSDASSDMNAFIGGNNTSHGGNADWNYNDPEGWCPRLSYFADGASPPLPFASVQSSYGTTILEQHASSDSMILKSFKHLNSTSIITNSQARRVIKFSNNRGIGNIGEAVTMPYGKNSDNILVRSDGCVCDARGGQTWHLTWMAKKDASANATSRMTAFALGLNFSEFGKFRFDFTGAVNVDAGSSTIGNPATGGTYYHKQVTLTTSYQEYSMTFTFAGGTEDSGTSLVNAIALRFDNDDVAEGPNIIYIDRPTLHPMNIKLVGEDIEVSAPFELSSASFGLFNGS